jgi:hypothetical protein
MRDRVRMVVDGAGSERPQRPVMNHHEPDREQERQPILVQRQEREHEEEMEVRLDRAARKVNSQRRRGDETERRGGRPALPSQTG